MTIKTNIGSLTEGTVLVLPVFSNHLEDAATIIPDLPKLLQAQDFTAAKGEVLTFYSLNSYKKVIVLGLGEQKECFKHTYKAMNFGGRACTQLNNKDEALTIVLSHIQDEATAKQLALNLTSGIKLKAYRYTNYFTTKQPKHSDPVNLKSITVTTNNVDVRQELAYGDALVSGMNYTRDLTIESPDTLNSEGFVKHLEELKTLGAQVEVLSEKELTSLGMNLLLAVNKGSANPAKVAIIKWEGGTPGDAPLAFVGKGVTFDSGGLSLKSPVAMIGMKGDMGGGATVAGLMRTLATRKAKVNAIGVIGLVENMVSSSSTRPGDVVKSYCGKTVEILNTDAEGRLVLADVLSYTQEKFKPKFIIDLATLTGAIIITLGYLKAGLFCNNEELQNELITAAKQSDDALWPLPVGDEYRSMMDSDIADICNIGKVDRAAGSVTAAVFLKEFIGQQPKWAHLDIAGVAWRETKSDLCSVGASGYGVRLLDTLVAKNYESK